MEKKIFPLDNNDLCSIGQKFFGDCHNSVITFTKTIPAKNVLFVTQIFTAFLYEKISAAFCNTFASKISFINDSHSVPDV